MQRCFVTHMHAHAPDNSGQHQCGVARGRIGDGATDPGVHAHYPACPDR